MAFHDFRSSFGCNVPHAGQVFQDALQLQLTSAHLAIALGAVPLLEKEGDI